MDAVAAYASRQIWTAEDIGYLETARGIEQNVLAVQSGSMPAVNVILSPESLEAAAKLHAAVFAQQLEGTSADGTSVNVRRIAGIYSSGPEAQDGYLQAGALEGYIYAADFTDAGGRSFNVEFTGDIKAGKNSAGNLSVYFHNTGTTRTYSADGGYIEEKGYLLADDADSSIIISTSGSHVAAGNGNNLIFVYGDNSSIQGGEGNDDIRLASGLSNVKIDTGAGDDSVSVTTAYNNINGATAYNMELTLNGGNNNVFLRGMNGRGGMIGGSIAAGNGDNNLNLSGTDGTVITLGDGDNRLNISEAARTEITLGDGDNHYKGYALSKGANLAMGNGSNSVDIYEVGQAQTVSRSRGAGSATLSLGNGDNQIKIYQIQSGSELSAGNGANTLDIGELESASALSVGNGDNKLGIMEIEGNSSVNIGNGDNKLYIHELESGSHVELGNGNNLAKIYAVEGGSSLGFGDGHNALQLYSLYNSVLSFGNGDNDAKIYKTYGDSTLNTGGGDNLVQIEYVEDASKINAGEGKNTFYLPLFSAGSSIFDHAGKAFTDEDVNSLKEQGLRDALSELTAARNERERQGVATLADMEKDAFFNSGYSSSEHAAPESIERMKAEAAAKAAAVTSYLKAAVAGSVHLTHGLLPENISRHISDAGLLDGMSPYHWFDPASTL
ncbi:MAG: hypothetical protein LBM00_08340 [Deltaproteobacteria bacterium]|nr:hypothetical protein [Deltaproteobacteria bacterium]